jgi:long-chain acyl-CoA synthetase
MLYTKDIMTYHFLSSLDAQPNLAAAFLATVDLAPNSVCYIFPTYQTSEVKDPISSVSANQVTWISRSRSEVKERVFTISHGLKKLGVNQGAKVAILSNTRPEWCEFDLAIQCLGAVTVSLYPSLQIKEITFILSDAQVGWVIVENQEQLNKVQEAYKNSAGETPSVITIESVVSTMPVITLDSLLNSSNCNNTSSSPSYLSSSLESPQTTRADLASIVYTSGTTGIPKGVMQSHGNHLSNVRQAVQSGICTANDNIFLFLPLAHSFARLMHYIGTSTLAPLSFPSVTDHQKSVLNLSIIAKELQAANPVFVPAVPRLFEKIRESILTRANERTIKGLLLKKSLQAASEHLTAKEQGKAPTLINEIWYQGTRPIRASIQRMLFGKEFRHAISGGAKLSVDVLRFFEALDILILEGYGLTETCVATHVNLPNRRRIGTVGPPLPDVDTKIGPDNEVWIRGPNIALGYYNREEETKKVWDADGWFHTGDTGKIDDDGFLIITGRLKEIIVTAGGKKIAPAMLETHFKRCPYISQLVPFGDEKPYLVALVTVNKELLMSEAPHILSSFTAPQITGELHSFLLTHLEPLNKELASFEQIKRWAILNEDFTTENDLLTPTQKPKRLMIEARWKTLIDSLY